MSNTLSETMILQKRLIREKLIRKQAEKIAEEKSRELFLKSEQLEKLLLAEVESKNKLTALYSKVLFLSRIDPLTQLMNRRSFFEDANNFFEEAKKYSRNLSCAMLDIDHFKNFNDSYGHDAGDIVLIQIAKKCKEIIRHTDLLARIGGEEFCFLFPDMDLDGATKFAERIRKCIYQLKINIGNHHVKATASIGVSSMIKSDINLEHMIKRSDQSLYIAKSSGRNCVIQDCSGQLYEDSDS